MSNKCKVYQIFFIFIDKMIINKSNRKNKNNNKDQDQVLIALKVKPLKNKIKEMKTAKLLVI